MSKQFEVLSEVNIDVSCDTVVAMAVYAGDKQVWVEQAVTSLVTQTYSKHIVIIVIDGDISDDLLTYLVNVSRPFNNILLVRGISNAGLSACMNFAACWALENISNADFFLRMDADDLCEQKRIEKQIDFLKKHPRISVLGTSLVEIDEQGTPVGARNLPSHHNEIVRYLPRRCAINHPTVAMRMDIFKQGFRYRENLKNTQDYFFWADLVAAGYKFANLNEKLLRFRRVNDFYKRRGFTKSFNEFRARFYTMKVLNRFSFGNLVYAVTVLGVRLMPSRIVKLAYKFDRLWLNFRMKHD